MNDQKPRRVKAKITRAITEIAIVLLDNDGNIEEVEETHEILDYDNCVVHEIRSVISTR